MFKHPFFTKQTIANRLLLWFLVIALLPLTLVTILLYNQTVASLSEEIQRGLLAVAENKVDRFETYANQKKRELTSLAQASIVATNLEQLNKAFQDYGITSPEYKAINQQVSPLLTFFAKDYGYYDLLLISASGDIVFSTAEGKEFGSNIHTVLLQNTELKQLFDEVQITKEIKISDFKHYPPINTPTIFIVAPIIKEGFFIGAIVTRLNPEKIYEFVNDYTGLGQTGETLIGAREDDEAIFIVPLRHDPQAAFNRRVPLGSELALPIQDAVQGIENEGFSIDYRNEDIIAVWRYIPSFRWGMVAKIDVSEAFASIISQRNTVIILSSITIILVISAAMLVAQSLSKPIVNLTQTIKQVSKGDLSQKAKTNIKNEIGELGDGFNKLIDSLQKETRERQLAEVALRESERKTRSIVQTAVDGIITINNQGAIETFNLAAERIFGYTSDEVIGKNVNILMPGPYHQEHDSYLNNYLKSGQKKIIGIGREVVGRYKNGRTFPIHLSVSEIKLDHQTIFSGIIRDITETKQVEIENENQRWMSIGQAALSDKMRGQQDVLTLSKNIIHYLCKYLDAHIGVLYIKNEDVLQLTGSYAYTKRKNLANRFKVGEGLVGQAALEKERILVTNVPNDYIKINSGLSETIPQNILILPFLYENEIMGIIEIGSLNKISAIHLEFLDKVTENIAIAFHTVHVRSRVDELLLETQQQTEELQVREEELQVNNEELMAYTESLKESESRLAEKQKAITQQNQALKTAQQNLEQKAKELTLASKYKSAFLANMSHELRTPLNSLLILARILADNQEGNLTQDQVESAKVIYNGGQDLLALINEILDLSKVEAGKMTFDIAPMPLANLATAMETQFAPIAKEKTLKFEINLADDLPVSIKTDQKRVEQIIKNLLANAFKFTQTGMVSLNIYRPKTNATLIHLGLKPDSSIGVSVIDTGIGISPKNQQFIFEAFQQADSSTSRSYGGTGLGLSISRELAIKLGGQIQLESTIGQGSIFTLYLPENPPVELLANSTSENALLHPPYLTSKLSQPISPLSTSKIMSATSIPDDRDTLVDNDNTLLVIEDDLELAKILYNIAHKKGFKCLMANDGKIGLRMAIAYKPTAIILDLKLPNISGWAILNTLKANPDTRHIPIHIMSNKDESLKAYKKGAVGYLTKPISQTKLEALFQQIEQFIAREIKTLLLIEDDAVLRQSMKKLLSGNDITIYETALGQVGLDIIKTHTFDCLILDLNLPDISGFELLNLINNDETIQKCPVIIYTGQALTRKENEELMRYTNSIIIKGVKSPERLLDETALFLHRVIAAMPQDKQETIRRLYDKDNQMADKKILIVDDDMRNAFALVKLLADRGLIVEVTSNGQDALELLAHQTDIDLVLMDIMMPIMDGFETIKRIREQEKFSHLPILALTAKAMKEDGDKCIAAGANDYLAKPINPEQLFAMLHIWLYQ